MLKKIPTTFRGFFKNIFGFRDYFVKLWFPIVKQTNPSFDVYQSVQTKLVVGLGPVTVHRAILRQLVSQRHCEASCWENCAV